MSTRFRRRGSRALAASVGSAALVAAALAGATNGAASTVPDTVPAASSPPSEPASASSAPAAAGATTAPDGSTAGPQSSAPPAASSVVASALTSPRHFAWDESGSLVVALAGSGGPNAPTEDTPTNAAIGPWAGGPSAAVAVIDPDTCPAPLATGLPSSIDATGGVLGAEDLAMLGTDHYVSVDGGGAGHGNPDQPSGVYRLNDEGAPELVADLSAWVRANPVAELPGDADPDAAGYSMVADEANDLLYVADPNSGQILSVTADGTVARVADLSAGHPVPTGLAIDTDGNLYVGTLTTAPFTDGGAKVMKVTPDGTVTDVWTGLTSVVDVAVAEDGSLYALEMSTGNLAEPPFFNPNSGRIVMQAGPDSSEPVVDGLNFPIAMEIGPDLAWYVSSSAVGSTDGSGVITRYEVGAGDVAPDATAAASASTPPVASCTPISETISALPAPTGSAPASPSTAAPADTGPASSVAGSTPAGGATVSIENFAFAPATLEVAAGTEVTFVNNDTSAHTATADDGSFDTGTLDAGASATVTFDTPGTYTYTCTFHPAMTGTIVVS